MAEANERLVYEHLGENALAYLLASDVETLRKRFNDTESFDLGAEREAALAHLIIVDEQMNNLPHEDLRAQQWISWLVSRNEPTHLSQGNVVRQVSGGERSQVPEGLGPLESTLADLTIDAYSGLLVMEPNESFRRTRLSVSLFRHPLNDLFQTLVLQDPELALLFSDESETSGRSGNTYRSTGLGGGQQLWLFAENLITAGWSAALLDSTSPSGDHAIQFALIALRTIRTSIKGEKASVPVRVGLTGVLLPKGCDELDLGWAKIRKVGERDSRLARATSLEGQLQTTAPDGNTITINYSGDLVIEFNIPYVIEISPHVFDLDKDLPQVLWIGTRLIEEFTQNIRLGLLLACPDLRPILVTTWQLAVDPLSPGSNIGWSDAGLRTGLTPTQLTEQQSDEWREWAKKIKENRTSNIGVAIRRMLMAIAERRTPEDVLVDAVIVWENLFGAKSETTFRISSSLAWLLGDSKEDRLSRQARYKKIYRQRSDVVHGVATVNMGQLQKVSSEAVQISIDALRAVFGEHAELLAHKTSEERSLHVLHAG